MNASLRMGEVFMVNAFDEILVTRKIVFVSDDQLVTLEFDSNPEVNEFRLEFWRNQIGRHGLRSRLEVTGKRLRKLEVARKIRFGVFISGQCG